MGGLRQRYNPGKEPAKPVIFLTEMVIEALLDGTVLPIRHYQSVIHLILYYIIKGPRSEKDIKLAVLDRCRELGVKSSNRGLIAGIVIIIGINSLVTVY